MKLFGILFCLLTVMGEVFGQEEVKEAVVLINCGEESGAGTLVGYDDERIYILTALHVIESEADIRVRFFDRREIDATIFRVDEAKDAAIITADRGSAFKIPSSFLPYTGILQPAEGIRVIGHPYGNNWDINLGSAIKTTSLGYDDDFFTINPAGVVSGSSGGAVINGKQELVGMVTTTDPVKAICLSIKIILKMLAYWKVPENLLVGIPLSTNSGFSNQVSIDQRRLIQNGDFQYQYGNWESAQEAYEAAYALKKTEGLQRKIADCKRQIQIDQKYVKLRDQGLKEKIDPQQALAYYQEAQTFRDTGEIRDLIDEIERLIASTKNRESQRVKDLIPNPKMVRILGGTFQMGSLQGEDDEKPLHEVTVSTFYLAKTEVTIGQYNTYLSAIGKTPRSGNDDHPVTHVSWYNAVAYCEWLS
ncbi:MAG: SUMF1/EgtB/PvdO family nonheme iron enzyme, partial [Bacteroidota bacterium]